MVVCDAYLVLYHNIFGDMNTNRRLVDMIPLPYTDQNQIRNKPLHTETGYSG